MTLPRQVLPGTTYLVTRRCTQRLFLLRPSTTLNAVFGYLLAVAAERFGIRIHAFCVLSNHFHLILTDPCARLPAFNQLLDGVVARVLNNVLDRRESFWAPNSYNAVQLVSTEDIIAKAAYVLANPVAAGLVRHGRDWPGLWSAPEQLGHSFEMPRPSTFFRRNGPLPESARLELTCPPGFASVEEFREKLFDALAIQEEKAANAAARRGRVFLGVRQVSKQVPAAQPVSAEPKGRLKPRVAALDRGKRIDALRRWRVFLDAYRVAFDDFRHGLRETIFPAGTYGLRVTHGVYCAGVMEALCRG